MKFGLFKTFRYTPIDKTIILVIFLGVGEVKPYGIYSRGIPQVEITIEYFWYTVSVCMCNIFIL